MKNVSHIISSGILLAGISVGSAMFSAGCVEERERVVYRDRELPPPPPVREEVVYQPVAYEPPPAPVVSVYERDLGPYGHWVAVRDYGRCWVPDGRPAGWQPYTVGHWVQSEYGWTWVADGDEAPWGVVAYHYGRWYVDPAYGWVWVPSTTWGPAWVSWREGGEYCGWAPLPPQCGVGDRVEVERVDYYVPADRYVYVHERYMTEPRVYDHFERNNVTIINRTTNITNITVENNRVINRGVAVDHVERYSQRRVERVQIQQVTSVEEARRARAEGRPVIYSPPAVTEADTTYRQRVEKRVSEADVAEKHRANVRAEDAATADQAEKRRANVRTEDAATAGQAEKHRANERTADQQAADQAERARVARRAQEAADAEKDRANQRAQQEAAQQQAEKDRANKRAQEDAAQQEAEKRRANERAAEQHPAPADAPIEAPADQPHGHHHAPPAVAPTDTPADQAPPHGHHAQPPADAPTPADEPAPAPHGHHHPASSPSGN